MKATKPSSDEITRIAAPGSRIAIIAGSGFLPVEVASSLVAAGQRPAVVVVEGEGVDPDDFPGCDMGSIRIEQFADLVKVLRGFGATHVVLAGGIARRPSLGAVPWSLGLLRLLPRVVAGLRKGDDGLLRALVGLIEERGIKVVGAHEIAPDLLATEGAMGKVRPTAADERNIEAGIKAARAIGALDIGQAAVAIGGRVVALEGVEGTDGLLERVRELRSNGRIKAHRRGVLVKCAKPGQELRADLPAIGPQSADAVHAAGLAGIAVEAGRSLVLQHKALIERADALGLFVVGFSQERM
ncbi:LpxI family protein [Mesorhizobium xinjiangense]|uniref:LpxI family protein n=1 Tax=Mesorhizobium xinjiangense TaxID=2678685 RepID=UPI001F2CA0E9|nr:UDP-2,3-diacylglucosamine diphosphatase LpxI [Mesorhizobium xinjiangense]